VLGHILAHGFWRRQGQFGGGTVSGNGIRYDYREYRNTYDGVHIFHGGRKHGKAECFLLMIENDGNAVIQSLKQGVDCALDPGGSGRSLVHAAIELAKQKGAKHVYLTDLTRKEITPSQSFRLPWMYFLTTGQTWYESVIPGLRPVEGTFRIEKSRACVRNLSWASVMQAKPGIIVPVTITDIDVTQPGSAMAVLQRIKENREVAPTFFAENEDKLVGICEIGYLYGMDWIVDL